MNKHLLLLSAAILLAATPPAWATSKPPSNSGPQAQAGANAGAIAANRTRVQTTVRSTNSNDNRNTARGGNASARGGSASASGSQTMQATFNGASGGPTDGTVTVRNAPDVAAPAIWSNNPCIISASGSVSVVGFGASIGAGIEDPDCTRRANAQLLAALGQPDAAREVLCANREVREAFQRSGRPCASDVARVQIVRAAVQPAPEPIRIAPAPVNTSGLSDTSCRTLRERGMAVQGCP